MNILWLIFSRTYIRHFTIKIFTIYLNVNIISTLILSNNIVKTYIMLVAITGNQLEPSELSAPKHVVEIISCLIIEMLG